MHSSLSRDMSDADRTKVMLLRERENLLKMMNTSMEKRSGDRFRMEIEAKLNMVNEHRRQVTEADKELL